MALSTCLLAQTVVDREEPPSWNESGGGEAKVGRQLSSVQVHDLRSLLEQFGEVFKTLPGHTTITEHQIVTGEERPVRLAPYRIPHAVRESVQRELQEMLEHGIIGTHPATRPLHL